MVYKHCVYYDGDEDCHKCCLPNHDKYIFSCPADCPDYIDVFGHGIDEQNGETWKDVPGFEGRYKISNHGRIRNRNGIVKQQQKRNGYLSVGLRDGSGRKYYSIHRLVAEIFVKNENPDLFNQVNHKDENKSNNRADNLEWCDGMYNTHYGTAIERMRERRWGNAPTIIPAEEGAKTEEDSGPWLCLSCRHYPPSSTDGKPCSQCNPNEVWHSCYDPAEEGE